MVRIADKPVTRRQYVSPFCGILIQLIGYVGLPIAAFMISFAMGHLWIYEERFRSMPRVHVTDALVQVVHDGKLCGWTSRADLQHFYGDALIIPRWDSMEEDTSGDGRTDVLRNHFAIADCDDGIEVPVVDAAETTVDVMLFLEYEVTTKIPVKITGVTHLHQTMPRESALRRVVAQGHVEFLQKLPLVSSPWVHYTQTYNYSLLSPEYIRFPSDLQPQAILTRYRARNESVAFVPDSIVTQDAARTASSSATSSSPFVVEVEWRMDVLPTLYEYVPGIGEVLKFGFLQWFVLYYTLKFLYDRVVIVLIALGLVQVLYSECDELEVLDERIDRVAASRR
eukprot:PhM_4_TR3271/c0_g1_i1/m.106518/K19362/TMEM231; transmembrane protein 231